MAVEAEIIQEPEHFSALLRIDGEDQPRWPCGSTYEEARTNVLREYPNAVFPKEEQSIVQQI